MSYVNHCNRIINNSNVEEECQYLVKNHDEDNPIIYRYEGKSAKALLIRGTPFYSNIKGFSKQFSIKVKSVGLGIYDVWVEEVS